MTVEIVSADTRWEAAGLDTLASAAVGQTLLATGLADEPWAVAILGCDDTRIAELNRDFRGKSAPTNVLSWPSEDRQSKTPGGAPQPPHPGEPELGDIAIAFDTCAREADAAGLPFDHHVTHLIVHGTLHLLGYDHETEADAARMEALEVEILATLGVPNPY